MDYIGPFDQPDQPNASYTNGDAILGTPGSIADARAWEYGQREIVAAIKAAGIVPTNTDLTQLLQAIPILASQSGNAYIISTPITKTIGTGGDFPDLPTAITWLSQRRIAATGFVTFLLPYGVGASAFVQPGTGVLFYHPDGSRVLIQGRPLTGGLPNASAFTITGNNAQARATDAANALTALRSVFQSEILFKGGSKFQVIGSLNFQDVLISSDGTGIGTDCVLMQNGGVYMTRCWAQGAANRGICAGQGAYLVLQGSCGSIGNGGNGISAELNATISVSGSITSFSNAQRGMLALYNSQIICLGYAGTILASAGNAADGVAALNGSSVQATQFSFSNKNGGAGFNTLYSSTIVANNTTADGNQDGYYALDNSHIDAQNTTGANSRFGYYAAIASDVFRAGGSTTGASANASPALNSVGNANSIIT